MNERVKMMFVLIAGLAILSANRIHPALLEKLSTLKDNEMIKVIVHMKNQPNLSSVSDNLSKQDKILFLQEFARVDQSELLNYLSNFPEEVSELQTFWIFNGLTLKATKNVIQSLALREDIDYITGNFIISLNNNEIVKRKEVMLQGLNWNLRKINADSCWYAGYDGTGIIIGNIDTGVDTSHPSLRGKWYPGGWIDLVNGQPGPYDDHGHGTFVMGIIAGGVETIPSPYNVGVAPKVNYIVAKAFDSLGGTNNATIHNAYQWFATQDVKIINNPFDENSNTSLEFWDDLLNLHNLGILPVFKIGTDLLAHTPGTYPTVVGVGATDSLDNIMIWSGKGPARDQFPWNDTTYWMRPDWNLIKPDISAPGHYIRSSWPGDTFGIASGTSWSASHVTGALAILLQKDSTIGHEALYQILLDNADHPPQGPPYPNNDYGWGRLNVYKALKALSVTEERASHKEKHLKLLLYPNPFYDKVKISYSIPDGFKNTALKIYHSNGRLVKKFKKLPIGYVIWNGTNTSGKEVSPGIYFIRVYTKDYKETKKVLFLRR